MPTSIRVLAVGSCYPPHHLGGYEIIWQGVTRELRAAGHEARILTTDYRRSAIESDPVEERDVHRELDWYWRDHEWRSLDLRARLRLERHNTAVFERHVQELRPDAIAWWPMGGMSLGLIERARRAGLRSILFVLDPWLHYAPKHDLWLRTWAHLGTLAPIGERLAGLPMRVDYSGAGRWIFCSAHTRDEARAAGLRSANSAVIHPGVASAFLEAQPELDSPPWRWKLLYVGRVVEQKGVDTAIRALARLPRAAALTIVGEGDAPYRLTLERLAAEPGVADRVQFAGARPRDQLIDVYRAADAVVFPVAWAEPWGLVPLEAMALGRPVVATGRGGSGEYLVDRANALLFEAGDAAGLAHALESLARDPELRDKLCAGGRETAERHGEELFNRRAVAEILRAAG